MATIVKTVRSLADIYCKRHLVDYGLKKITPFYRYKYVEDKGLSEADREEHNLSGGISFFHRTGFFARINQTYMRQNRLAYGFSNENIWLSDASIGYEIPGKKVFCNWR